MSNLNDIYTAAPQTSLALSALLYALGNPGETGGDDDWAISTNDLLAQIIGTRIDSVKLTWNGVASIDVGTGLLVAENRDVINITSAITKSGLSLSVSTWYHVYVYLNSGTPAAEVVTTAPVAWKGTAYSKTGDTSRRYVGSIKTDGSGNVYYFTHNPHENFMMYGRAAVAASPFRVLSAGTAATATSVSCSGIAPVTSTDAYLRYFSSADQNHLVGDSTLTTSLFRHSILAGSTTSRFGLLRVPLVSQAYYYLFNAAVGSGSASHDVLGYWFDR